MKYLLDTHLLIWVSDETERLSPTALRLIEDAANDLFFSIASLWEIAIKRALGKKDFVSDPRILRLGLLENGYRELAITSEHAFLVGRLRPIHRDPFDRMLIAQAKAESMIFLTTDTNIAKYPGPIRKV